MDEQLPFEEALNRLNGIVQKLQTGGLKLEEAIALFEEGLGLSRLCNERLNAAELKISQLNIGAEPLPEPRDEQHC